jgi:hypothetical protein
MAVSAVRAENSVLFLQMRANANRYRFLADVSVARAMNQSALMRSDELFLGTADAKHLLVEVEESIFRKRNFGHVVVESP